MFFFSEGRMKEKEIILRFLSEGTYFITKKPNRLIRCPKNEAKG